MSTISELKQPRLLLTAPHSGSGKTFLTAALKAAFLARGLSVQSYKCGPDRVDPLWHGPEGGRPTHNLDAFLLSAAERRQLVARYGADLALVEGVMGYYDGRLDVAAWPPLGSSAQVAQDLAMPAVLIIDAKGAAQSLLAELLGFATLDPQTAPRGYILNRCSAKVAEKVAAEVAARGLPLKAYGFVPENPALACPERPGGLLLPQEEAIDWTKRQAEWAELVERSVDLEGLLALAETAPPLAAEAETAEFTAKLAEAEPAEGPLVVYAADEAFYAPYPAILDDFRAAGCRLQAWSPLKGEDLPAGTRLLLLGQAALEVHAAELAAKVRAGAFQGLLSALEAGLPLIAEGSATVFLAEGISLRGEDYRFLAFLPEHFDYSGRLQHFGYAEALNNWPRPLDPEKTRAVRNFHRWQARRGPSEPYLSLSKAGELWSDGYRLRPTARISLAGGHLCHHGQAAHIAALLVAGEL